MTNWGKFVRELDISIKLYGEKAPLKEQMLQGLKLSNAQLDYILSGEWENDQRRKKYTKRV